MRFTIQGMSRCLAAALLATTAVAAEDEGEVYTNPEEAGPYYAYQGEYVGDIDGGNGPTRFGTQVIALGDDAFSVVGHRGGLPGAGWDQEGRVELEGRLRDGVVRVDGGNFRLTISPEEVHVYAEGRLLGVQEKVERESPTLGAEPPEGAVVLFDGESAEAFDGGEVSEDGLLLMGCETKQKWGDHSLHLEFRTPFQPSARGQQRGNSGVYVQGRYECQVLDSFGLTGENNECGGFYQVAAPAVNMCLPPLAWQTYDIDFTAAKYDDSGEKTSNARVTVTHNGVVIHDDLELPNGTPGRHAEAPGPQAMYLQDHTNPVVYRNVWVVEK